LQANVRYRYFVRTIKNYIEKKVMNNVKTILLIGRTGNGKSTLANVLTDTSKFTEGEFVVSETRKVSDCVFEYESIKYRVIDTVVVRDTKMTMDKVLRKLALVGWSVKNGLNQIFFVTDGQLVRETKSTYDLLEKVVFDDKVTKYTTVIRTNFDRFGDKTECDEDRKTMIEDSKEFKNLIGRCNGIIHINNPPVNIIGNEKMVVLNKKKEKNQGKSYWDICNLFAKIMFLFINQII